MSIKNYVNLHTHTQYSMLDGHGSVDGYMERAASLGMPALATTDHGNIHSWIKFYDAAKRYNVKPILGEEFYQARTSRFSTEQDELSRGAKDEWDQRGPYHLTIMAENKSGYNNIIKLSSKAYLEGYYQRPRIDHELISQHADGIIVLSGCLSSEVSQALLRNDYPAAVKLAATMQDIVGKDNYFIEIMDHGLEEQKRIIEDLIRVGKEIGAKIVPSGDCHYVSQNDSHGHDVLLCISTGAQLASTERFRFSNDHFYLKSYDEMALLFDKDYLANTLYIAEKVDLELNFDENHYPVSDIPEGHNISSYLEHEVWNGAKLRFNDDIPSYVEDRLKYELRVVKDMGFESYFLVVADIINWAKDNGIRVGPGRGSSSGSMIAYCMRITEVNPFDYDLPFERFLVEGRKNPPDIDIDVDTRYRGAIVDYVKNKYGEERIANICTFTTINAKTAVKDSCRVLGFPFSLGDKINKLMPPPVLGVTKSLEECLDLPDFKKLYDTDQECRLAIDTALTIENSIRQDGVHAAGIVIGDAPLIEHIPIKYKPKDQITVTQWDMDEVDRCGLLKVDFLGLRNLDIIDECLRLIKERHDIEIDPYKIPLDDKLTFERLQQGDAVGVFQLESTSIRNMMHALKPENIEDIMALVSLHRPGPMGSGMDKQFIRRKHGSKFEYAHPKLKDILSSTYGIVLYQEDLLNVAKHIAGFNPAEADSLRKVVGKKKMEEIPKFRKQFVDGCIEHSGLTVEQANKLFDDLEYFAGYGFSKNHAAAYCIVSYITAWLKFNYTTEFMCALLVSVIGNKDKQKIYLAEAKRLGIDVLPPDIMKSDIVYKVIDDKTIIFGLAGIEKIGQEQARQIIEYRADKEINSIYDFTKEMYGYSLKSDSLEALIKAGALDSLSYVDDNNDIGNVSKVDILNMEREYIGLYVTANPIDDVWHELSKTTDSVISDIEDIDSRANLTLAGVLYDFKKKITKSGKSLATFTLEDTTGTAVITAFHGTLAKLPEDICDGDFCIIDVTVDKNDVFNAETKIILRNFMTFRSKNVVEENSVILNITNPNQAQKISDILKKSPIGNISLYFDIIENNITYRFLYDQKVNTNTITTIEKVLELGV